MMPAVYDLENKSYRSMESEYQEISAKLYGADHKARVRLKPYREKILGPDVIANYDVRYSELSLIWKIGLDVWEGLTVREKGMWIAYHSLDNMEQFIRNYKTNMKHLPKK